MDKQPKWLVYGEGFADVTLDGKGLEVNGAKLSQLRMREPDVNDQLAMDAVKGGDAAKELSMMANLCEVSQDDLRKLSLRNYKRMQTAFVGFLD